VRKVPGTPLGHFTGNRTTTSLDKFLPLGYWLDDSGSIPGRGHRVKTGSGAHPDYYSVGSQGPYTGVKAAGGIKLSIHVNLVLRLRMSGAIPPLLQCIHGVVLS
jgi:hypothetical protein